MNKAWPILIVILAAVLAGCASNKEYVAPDNPDVQECISSCSSVRTQCRAQAQDTYKICRNNYEFEEQRYNYCVRTGNKACMKPPRCPPPETRHCTNRYDGCYQSCGGEIRVGDS